MNPHVKRYFDDALNSEFFHYSNETVFETKLIKTFLADVIFKQCSFKAFADAYNFQYTSIELQRSLLNPKRLSEIFFCHEILKYYSENSLSGPIECK